MGMDVYGKEPTSKTGEYFRNNVWWWRPLADYCVEVAPIAAKCKYWQSNDGDGLGAKDARTLADTLQAEIDAGRTLVYEKAHTGAQELTPNEDCRICGGTGTRKAVPSIGAGDPNKGGIVCNGCEGKGTVRPHSTAYPFSVENVERFVAFLRDCGGFEIC